MARNRRGTAASGHSMPYIYCLQHAGFTTPRVAFATGSWQSVSVTVERIPSALIAFLAVGFLAGCGQSQNVSGQQRLTTAQRIRLDACQNQFDGQNLLWLRRVVPSVAPKIGACRASQTHLTDAESAELAGCQKRFNAARGIRDAQLNARQRRVNLLIVTGYAETISSGIPGIGGGFNGPWNDKDEPNGDLFFINHYGMSSQTDTPVQQQCRDAYEHFAAAYNEETGRLFPHDVIDNLIRSKACRVRKQDVALIIKTRAVAPSGNYKPWC